MSERRAQGRPTRGADEVGRDRIIEGTRAFLRSPATGDITRKDVAQFVGVTPALISYYFPNTDDLLEAAVEPVVEAYAEKLTSIVHSDDKPLDRLRRVIVLFIECNAADRRIVDCFVDLMSTRPDGSGKNHINVIFRETREFMERHFIPGAEDLDDAEFFASALWSVCKFTTPETAVLNPLSGKLENIEALISQRANRIYMLMTGCMHLRGATSETIVTSRTAMMQQWRGAR
jgi:AcrR family transcriptional regulator